MIIIPRLFISLLVATFASGSYAQEVVLKSGESADLYPVYWIANCKSLLKKFVGVEALLGPPSLKVSLREEPVIARRQGCTDKVPGAMLVLTAGEVTAPQEATARIVVRYDTEDGIKQSVHPVKILVVPAAK